MQQHFSSCNTNLYLLLAQYIDIVARKSNMTCDQVNDFPWQQLYANLDEDAQNNINVMFNQSDSKISNQGNDNRNVTNDNKNSADSNKGNINTAELYHGPFKGKTLLQLFKYHHTYTTTTTTTTTTNNTTATTTTTTRIFIARNNQRL